MLSTMQDEQLSLATLLHYASTFQGDSTVSTWTGAGLRTMTYRELGAEAARLAHALRGLGIGVGDRVGTFMWNNNEHMVAYVAVPAMGAVLHALNIRFFPEQLVYVANHAEDQVVIVDGTLVPMFAQYLPNLKTVRHVIVANGDASALSAPEGVQVHSYTELLAAQSVSSTSRSSTNARRPVCATPPAPPATRRASSTRTARTGCTLPRCARPTVWASPPPTRCSPSCRSSTPTPGACRTRRSCRARMS
ncbi:hypothetical protein GCM10027088_48150 [Nocardia goodfellowii]|uniref:Acyl-CoA synthetase (AMP-forming)/AMP-acid ligase II n=1 Tax=Nocardia goodfellowii TaxID=882446 RepID=A0ABS4QNU0_9NOCA|nr:acyl-CoA synthetase (AMP-forming)/AMP-acid ligase II [Nocardia goodfellowii]